MAAAAVASLGRAVTKPIVSAGDDQALSKNDTLGDFTPGTFIDLGHSAAGNIHSGGTLLVGQSLGVHKADRLELIQCKDDAVGVRRVFRGKGTNGRFLADPPVFLRSWHRIPPFVSGICRL